MDEVVRDSEEETVDEAVCEVVEDPIIGADVRKFMLTLQKLTGNGEHDEPEVQYARTQMLVAAYNRLSRILSADTLI